MPPIPSPPLDPPGLPVPPVLLERCRRRGYPNESNLLSEITARDAAWRAHLAATLAAERKRIEEWLQGL